MSKSERIAVAILGAVAPSERFGEDELDGGRIAPAILGAVAARKRVLRRGYHSVRKRMRRQWGVEASFK